MQLRDFLDQLPIPIKVWAAQHDLHANLLSQYANPETGKRPGPRMAKRISAATGGLVPLAKLRPDLWG